MLIREHFKVLKANEQSGFTYLNKGERNVTRILKGVDRSFDAEMVKEELKLKLNELTEEEVRVQVDRLESQHSRKNET